MNSTLGSVVPLAMFLSKDTSMWVCSCSSVPFWVPGLEEKGETWPFLVDPRAAKSHYEQKKMIGVVGNLEGSNTGASILYDWDILGSSIYIGDI